MWYHTWVDMAQSTALTFEQAVMLEREKLGKDDAKRKIVERKAAVGYEHCAGRIHRTRQEAAQLRDGALGRRASLSGLAVVAFRQQLRPLWKKTLIREFTQ